MFKGFSGYVQADAHAIYDAVGRRAWMFYGSDDHAGAAGNIRAELAPTATLGLRPIVALSLFIPRRVATIDAIGTGVVQLQGAGTLTGCVTVPSTMTWLGRVPTESALPVTVRFELAVTAPPTWRSPPTVLVPTE